MARNDTYPGALDRLPSGSWRWRVEIDGEKVAETWSDSLSDEEAASKARERYEELRAQLARGDGSDVRLNALITVYKDQVFPRRAESTRRAYLVTFRAFRTYYRKRNPSITAIRRGDIKSFMGWRRVHGPDGTKRKEPLSEFSIQRAVGALSALFAEAVDREWIESSPTHRIKVETPEFKPVLLSGQEYEDLLQRCESRPMLRMFVLLAGEAGLRRSEALDVRWADLDLAAGFLDVVHGRDGRTTKGKQSRAVPMTTRLRGELREHAARYRLQAYGDPPKRSPYVLHHVRPRGQSKKGDPFKQFDRGLATVAEEVGLPEEWRYHDLRHRCCTRWLAEGYSPEKVRRAMGHSDLSTTLRYSHLVRSDLEEMVGEDDRSKLSDMVG